MEQVGAQDGVVYRVYVPTLDSCRSKAGEGNKEGEGGGGHYRR